MKIAIFDRGFDGYEKSLGGELPADTKFFAGKIPREATDDDRGKVIDHGKFMALLLNDLMTGGGQAPQFAPEIYLYQVNGYTNFRDAVEDVIVKKIDIVSYSEVRYTGGNFDGQGVWNTLINKATKAGIIWVNAAGNTGQLTYNGPIVSDSDGNVILPDQNNSLAISCDDQKYKCHVRVVLNWSDFQNTVDAGTNKDLDMELYDSRGKRVGESYLTQITKDTPPGEGKTLNPREAIETDLNYGTYFIVVKKKSDNFTAQDKLRIIIDADGNQVTANHFDSGESVLSPADNPNVITVGASNFKNSALSKSLMKPELLIDSPLYFSGNLMFQGSTNSALMAVAGFGILKSLDPSLDRESLLEYTSHPFDYTHNAFTETKILLRKARSLVVNPGRGIALGELGFKGQGANGCFHFEQTGLKIQGYLAKVASLGAVTLASDGTYKIMIEDDPITLDPALKRQQKSDAILKTPTGFKVVERAQITKEDSASVEVIQKPVDSFMCIEDQDLRARPQMNSAFWLPSL